MNTITVDSNIYKGAEWFAKRHHTSVEKMVEDFLSKFSISMERKKDAPLPEDFARLEGILAGVEKQRGTDDKLDCLLEKYK